ncbi:phage holin family protein [Halomonas cupida]|uniref:putative holin n=1 Tax=Halomonas cupida TaxID=44933 RepID=UPI0039B420A5
MTDPSTTAITKGATLAATLFGMMPGVDPNAVVGAFCGATLFVVSAKELSIFERLTYLIISFLIGYMAGPAMLGDILDHTAVSAFVASAVTVTAGLRVIESVKTLDIKSWLGGRK